MYLGKEALRLSTHESLYQVSNYIMYVFTCNNIILIQLVCALG